MRGAEFRRKAEPCLPSFPAETRVCLLAFLPQNLFQSFKNLVYGLQNCFHWLPRGVFSLLGAFPRLSHRVFNPQKNFYCFPDAISTFRRTFVAFLVCFHASKVFSRLVPAYFRASKVLLLPLPRCFRTSKELSLLSQRVFTLCECSRSPAHRVSDFREHSRGLPWAFSAFESSPTASPKVFSRFRSVFPGQS